MQSACSKACAAYREKDYRKALELLLIAENEARKRQQETGVAATLLKRIQHNIVVCRSQLEANVSLSAIELMIDRKGKSKTAADPMYLACSKFNNALILFHRGKFQESITVLHPLTISKNKFYLKSLLLLFEIHFRTGNLEGTHQVYQQIDALPLPYCDEYWKKVRPSVLHLLKAKMQSTLPIVPYLIDSKNYEQASDFQCIDIALISLKILISLDSPEEASQYTQSLALLVTNIPPLFQPFYQALLYHYLRLINEKLKCFTAAQLYALKSSNYLVQFANQGFRQ
jgi:hypothetical protein